MIFLEHLKPDQDLPFLPNQLAASDKLVYDDPGFDPYYFLQEQKKYTLALIQNYHAEHNESLALIGHTRSEEILQTNGSAHLAAFSLRDRISSRALAADKTTLALQYLLAHILCSADLSIDLMLFDES